MNSARLKLSFRLILIVLVGLCAPPDCQADTAKSFKKQADAFLAQALAQKKSGDLQVAAALLDKAIALQPQAANLHLEKSIVIWDQQEDDKAALDEVDIACKLSPNTDAYWLHRAQILFRLNRKGEALESSARAIKCGLQDPEAYSGRARLLMQLKRYEDAEKDLNIALKLNPNDIDACSIRADAALQLHHWQCAIDDTNVVIKDRKKNPKVTQVRNAFLWKARAYAGLKQKDLAKAAMLEGVKQWPDDRQMLKGAFELFQSIGDKADAEAIARKMKLLDVDVH